MVARVSVGAIVEGLEMQSDDMHSFLHRPTGRVVTVSDDALAAAEEDDEEWVSNEELADARKIVTTADEYLALPDRVDTDEYRMMERFAISIVDSRARDEALTSLRGRGAFRYFKDTVYRLGLTKSWFAFRRECYCEVARAWCETHGVEYDDSARPWNA